MEDSKIGVCNFDYFAIDETADKFYLFGNKKLTYGEFGCAVSNISCDDVTRLLILSGELDKTRMELLVHGGYERKLYEKANLKFMILLITYQAENRSVGSILRARLK